MRGYTPSFMPSRHTTLNGMERIGISVQKLICPARKRWLMRSDRGAPPDRHAEWSTAPHRDSAPPSQKLMACCHCCSISANTTSVSLSAAKKASSSCRHSGSHASSGRFAQDLPPVAELRQQIRQLPRQLGDQSARFVVGKMPCQSPALLSIA